MFNVTGFFPNQGLTENWSPVPKVDTKESKDYSY